MSAGTVVQKKGTPFAGRQLGDLISIGPAMLRDFELLGIGSVAQLARQNPQRLYERLSHVTGQRQDPCVLDVFCAAVAQARSAAAGGAMPVVVLEQEEEARKKGSNKVRR